MLLFGKCLYSFFLRPILALISKFDGIDQFSILKISRRQALNKFEGISQASFIPCCVCGGQQG